MLAVSADRSKIVPTERPKILVRMIVLVQRSIKKVVSIDFHSPNPFF